MSALAHIGREFEKKLLTAILLPGFGHKLLLALAETPGVLSISHHHARGVGTQRIRSGQMYFKERDVLLVLVESEHADRLFAEIFDAGQIGRPGGGVIFAEQVLRGHPLMPFEGADW